MQRLNDVGLPKLFCWTRFGTEAAEPIEEILHRKERERKNNHGLFLWGVGNAVGPSIRELTLRNNEPEVIFSPIKSAPRAVDVYPETVVTWTSASGLDGRNFKIPAHSRVISRYNPTSPKQCHYALVCFSSSPLLPLLNGDKILFEELRNLRSRRPVGASQVTAVVERVPQIIRSTKSYDVAIRAHLVHPYFVRLLRAIRLPQIELAIQ